MIDGMVASRRPRMTCIGPVGADALVSRRVVRR
jgi:hypothetical protein